MKIEVFGVQKVDFTNKEGEAIQGFSINATSRSNADYIYGRAYTKVWLKPEAMQFLLKGNSPDYLVGKTLDVEFNEKGKPIDFEILEKPKA